MVLGTLVARAQDAPFGEVPDHTPMMNSTWETINKLMYKVTYKDNKTVYTPHFPDELKAIDKKTVTLPVTSYPSMVEGTTRHLCYRYCPSCSACSAAREIFPPWLRYL